MVGEAREDSAFAAVRAPLAKAAAKRREDQLAARHQRPCIVGRRFSAASGHG